MEKNSYSPEELQEFREIIEKKLAKARRNYDLLVSTLDTVYVYDKKRIEVVFSFDDVLMKAIEKYQKGVKEA